MVEFLELVLKELDLAPVATIQEVVNAYTGSKRKRYEQAMGNYLRNGLSYKDALLQSFVKFEKVKLGSAPRCINPRSSEFNLVLGKYLKFNEKNYFKAIANVFQQLHTVIKGLDVKDSATALQQLWDVYDDVVAVGGDASKFDMHVSREALEYEHLFYLLPHHGGTVKQCLEDYRRVQEANLDKPPAAEGFPELSWLLSKQLDNRGIAYFPDGKLSFTMRGTRASGDLNTSLGNCLIMCALSFTWSKRVGVTTKLGNNGDDCVTFMERRDLAKWSHGQEAFYASKGFRMVLEEPVYQFEQVEFCQSKPVLLDSGYVMVRNPETLVTKATMCLHPCSSFVQLRKWMMAVGTCEGNLNQGVPVLEAFARAYRRNGVRCSRKLVELVRNDSSRVRNDTSSCISDVTRLSFYLAWGITPDQQVALEDHYNHWRVGQDFGDTLTGDMAEDKFLEPIDPMSYLLCPTN